MQNNQSNILQGKTALIFGAGGAIGSTVAKTFAAEGANVFISGRHSASVKKTAVNLKKHGFETDIEVVDATNEMQVESYIEKVFKATGKIDIVFNAIGSRMDGATQVMPSTQIPLDIFKMYMNNMVLSQFLTARVAAKYMMQQGKGSIVMMGATPSKGVAPFLPGACAGHAAVDGLTRCLATEFGAMGIRVNAVMSGGMQETPNIQEVLGGMAKIIGVSKEALAQQVKEKAVLKRGATLTETAAVIAFIASDRASSITGAIINASCGEVLD
jgi:3-oxoacyl-[acyl-carrier protein] reductase